MGENLNLIWWVWAVSALVFAAAEILTAGFVMLCFAAGAAAAAVLAYLGFNLVWQLSAFILVSAIAVLLSRPIARRVSNANGNAFGVDRVIGKQAIVIEEIDPRAGHGRVRVDSEEWRAATKDGSIVAAGQTVYVRSIEGTRLFVSRTSSG